MQYLNATRTYDKMNSSFKTKFVNINVIFFLHVYKDIKENENWLKSIGNATDKTVSVTKFNLKTILLVC